MKAVLIVTGRGRESRLNGERTHNVRCSTQDYHKFDKSSNHVSDMDATKLADCPNLDPDGKYIISTR